MTDIKGDKLYVNLSASQVRQRLIGFGHGVRKIQSAGKQQAVIIHTATGRHLKAVYLASLEMSEIELATRLMCSISGVNGKAIRIGKLTDGDSQRWAESSWTVAQADMHIDDGTEIRFPRLKSRGPIEASRGRGPTPFVMAENGLR